MSRRNTRAMSGCTTRFAGPNRHWKLYRKVTCVRSRSCTLNSQAPENFRKKNGPSIIFMATTLGRSSVMYSTVIERRFLALTHTWTPTAASVAPCLNLMSVRNGSQRSRAP